MQWIKDVAGKRPINISQTFKLQSGYAIELAKILQMKGRGIDNTTGLPLSVKEISHPDLCQFLNLKGDKISTISQIRKSIIQLVQYGYSKYRYSSKLNSWQRIDIKTT